MRTRRRTGRLLIALVIGASVSTAYADDAYQCKCCGSYFGKNPDAPSYWKKTLSFGRLVRDHKYDEVLARFDYRFRQNDYTLSDVGWVGEALFAKGALKSGIHNPLEPYRYFQAEKPKDLVADDLQWMHAKFGRKIWDAPVIAEYGPVMLCATGELRKAYPQAPRMLDRYLSALIVTGRFDDVLKEVRALRPGGLTYVNDIGEHLAKIMQEYIGMARYDEGADYLATVKKVHGLSRTTRDHWVARLARGAEQEALTPEQKKRLLAKIRGI